MIENLGTIANLVPKIPFGMYRVCKESDVNLIGQFELDLF